MKTLLVTALAACCLFAIHPSVLAQEGQSPARIPVLMPSKFSARVDVNFDVPEKIEHPLAKCILDDLQTIEDVILTKSNPQYRITVMAIPNKTSEATFGFTFSVTITQPLDINILRPFLSREDLGEDEKKILLLIGRHYEKIEKQSLLTCSPDELGRICKEIVAGFNADVLEKDRRLWNSAWNIPEETGNQAPPDHD